MILEVCWDGLGTLSFGLSQLHNHGSWLVCEVALSIKSRNQQTCDSNNHLYKTENVELVSPLLHHSTIFLHVKEKKYKEKGPHVKEPVSEQTCDNKKNKQMWKGGGTTSEKCGYGWGNMGEVASMEPS